jgi:hypothetical protein
LCATTTLTDVGTGVARWLKYVAGYPSVYRCVVANMVDALDATVSAATPSCCWFESTDADAAPQLRQELRTSAQTTVPVDRYETSGRTNLGIAQMTQAVIRHVEGVSHKNIHRS